MAQTAASPSSSSSALAFRCSLPSPSDAFAPRFTDRGMSRMPHQCPASPEMPASPPFVFLWFMNAASLPRPPFTLVRNACRFTDGPHSSVSGPRASGLPLRRPACLGPPPSSACGSAFLVFARSLSFLGDSRAIILRNTFLGMPPRPPAGRGHQTGPAGVNGKDPTPGEEAEGGAARRRRPRVRWR